MYRFPTPELRTFQYNCIFKEIYLINFICQPSYGGFDVQCKHVRDICRYFSKNCSLQDRGKPCSLPQMMILKTGGSDGKSIGLGTYCLCSEYR